MKSSVPSGSDLIHPPRASKPEQLVLLEEILDNRLLEAHFQPVLNLGSGEVIGFEGLIRGPAGTPLRAPVELFRCATKYGYALRLERLCRQTVLETFATLGLSHKLFLNVRPQCLALPALGSAASGEFLARLGLSPQRIVIELTENLPIFDFTSVRAALTTYRNMGFSVALDDMGEGFASFRTWSELRPEYVKADMHFIQGIDSDPLKLQFLRSIQQIADTCRSHIVAEGIETEAELAVIRDLGIPFGQGNLIGAPATPPALHAPENVLRILRQREVAVYPENLVAHGNAMTAEKLLIYVDPVIPATPNEEVYTRFAHNPALHAIPVVDNGIVLGLLNRHAFMDGYTRPYRRELFGRKPCHSFMDAEPLVLEKHIALQELSSRLVDAESRYLAEGFVLTEHGRYAGLGTGQDLVREITNLQIIAARYANPLTLLPGNVPVNEHIERLLRAGGRFVACYCDLDYFKPFNDAYGYRRGDDMIQLAGRILRGACDPRRDFIGHIGGDDFILLLQSIDWSQRSHEALKRFDRESSSLYSEEDLARGGLLAQDRSGNSVVHPLSALSIGAVVVESGDYTSHYEVSAAAAEAKRQAKRTAGSTLFVERRRRGA